MKHILIILLFLPLLSFGQTLKLNNNTVSVDASGSITCDTLFVTLPIVAGDQYEEGVCVVLSGIAAPANETPSSILHVIITRLGSSSGLDTYTTNKTCGGTNSANLGVTYIDAHYPVSKLGSRTTTID